MLTENQKLEIDQAMLEPDDLMDAPALIQERYLRDGVYRFYCTACNGVLNTDLRMSDHCEPEAECKAFPIRFCPSCGVRFLKYVY